MVAISAKIQPTLQHLSYHSILEHTLIQIFYDGLEAKDRKIIDAASQGTLTNKNPIEARSPIQSTSFQTQQLQQLEFMPKRPTPNFLLDEEFFARITHIDVSNDDRISETIEIQVEENYLLAEEIVAKLESFKHESVLDFNLDEADEPCITVQTETPKEEIQFEESKEEEFLSQPKRSLEIVIHVPFPSQLVKHKKEMIEDEQLKELCTLEVNISLISKIENTHGCAIFLKELCTAKRKLKGNELICMNDDTEPPCEGNLSSFCYISLEPTPKPLAISIEQPPKVEIKKLPDNLKYVFLGENGTLFVIISNKLEEVQEEKLVRILKENRQDIGWTIADIYPRTAQPRRSLPTGSTSPWAGRPTGAASPRQAARVGRLRQGRPPSWGGFATVGRPGGAASSRQSPYAAASELSTVVDDLQTSPNGSPQPPEHSAGVGSSRILPKLHKSSFSETESKLSDRKIHPSDGSTP
ncbi:hypothetical protein CCACVL1_09603 [Corchorus capsularis]|uniref:Uncharacterized protein n=1 Tax=Corchorus capsularis TaxID=210143 RepID=A0A1R3IV04_COCAP|nr:hypothetical protein CCACVL1_09603 [Corchorus capsularis]